MVDYLNELIVDLLHIDEGNENKLINLKAGGGASTFVLSNSKAKSLGEDTFELIKKRIGKVGNTILNESSLVPSNEQKIGNKLNMYDWIELNGEKDPKRLDAFIKKIYKETDTKGNNPLFISIGALKWKIEVTKDNFDIAYSPFMIFPIRLNRASSTNPVSIEFINDEAYFNPCLFYRLKRDLEQIIENFPYPEGMEGNFDEPLELDSFKDVYSYLNKVKTYISNCKIDEETVFEFDENYVAISTYNHNELCMYYDIKRNKEKIINHPLILRMFNIKDIEEEKVQVPNMPEYVLPYDNVQDEIIYQAVNGQSMVIKGPPGSGKTLTIANMIVSLIGNGKRVLVSSKKLAALSEIYAKVPKELRKFLLLLNSESEVQASKINPTNIRKELQEIIQEKRTYSVSKNIKIDKESYEMELSKLAKEITDYQKLIFGLGTIFNENYYEVLDEYFKNENVPLVELDIPEVLSINREQFNLLVNKVEEISSHYKILTSDYSHSILKSPYYNVKGEKINNIEEDVISISYEMEKIKEKLEKVYSSFDYDLKEINLFIIKSLINNRLNDAQIEEILNSKKDINNLVNAYNSYLENDENKYREYISMIKGNPIFIYQDLLRCKFDNTLTLKDINRIKEHLGLFSNDNQFYLNEESIDELWNVIQEFDLLSSKKEEHEFNVWSTFDKNISTNDKKYLISSYPNVRKYYFEKKNKPGLFDFKAKTIYKNVLPYCLVENTSFEEIVFAMNELYEVEEINYQINKLVNGVNKIFQTRLNIDQISCIFMITKRFKLQSKFNSLKEYISSINLFIDKYEKYALEIFIKDEYYSIQDLLDVYKGLSSYKILSNCLTSLEIEGISLENNENKIDQLVESILGIYELNNLSNSKILKINEIRKLISELSEVEELSELINKLSISLDEFGINHYASYYSINNIHINLLDIEIYINQSRNRNVLASGIKYVELMKEELNSPIYNFFEKLILNKIDLNSNHIKNIFINSMYYAGLSKFNSLMGPLSYNLGNSMENNFIRFDELQEKILSLNVNYLENKLMSSIDENDSTYNFLSLQKDKGTLRRLFKLYPEAILKLKKCLIASPSTISLLFRREEYEKFDVLIVDEASQLEPVSILPLMFRTKQCVIVGDEYQMPPMRDFKRKSEKEEIKEDDFSLEIEDSALSMILKSGNFTYYPLQCHYRSRTESLIQFSRNRYYNYMKTFPVPTPRSNDLGLFDEYVENGTCVQGVNIIEANRVVELIESHYQKYFVDNKLKESLGIVTFGIEQSEKILDLIKLNKNLNSKIQLSFENRNPNDVIDKVFFIKPIEKVQGQEADHLIVSFTYGVNKDGKKQNSFGKLNRGKLGECIFNVAVTRAKKTLTAVHSIHSNDISSENIKYIKDYLEIVERFGKEDTNQFLQEEIDSGFVNQIFEYIESLGIEKERIICNYGMTYGSVRIPLVILSKDRKKALHGFFLEKNIKNDYNYFDYNIKYYKILVEQFNWNLSRIFIHEWFVNNQVVKENIKKVIDNINKGEK